jgi:hypothetical protein
MRWIGEWWSRQGLAGVILSELICSGVWVWWMRRRLIPPTFGVGGAIYVSKRIHRYAFIRLFEQIAILNHPAPQVSLIR